MNGWRSTPPTCLATSVAGARLLHVDDVDADAAIEPRRSRVQAGIPVTSDIDRVTDRRREALVAAVTIPIFAEHVPTSADRRGRYRACAAHAARRAPRHAVRHARRARLDAARRRISCIASRRRECRPSTPPAPATCFAARSSTRCCAETGPLNILRFANAAAALSCTREGALDSVPTLSEVEEFLRTLIRRALGLARRDRARPGDPRVADRRNDDRDRGSAHLIDRSAFDRSSRGDARRIYAFVIRTRPARSRLAVDIEIATPARASLRARGRSRRHGRLRRRRGPHRAPTRTRMSRKRTCGWPALKVQVPIANEVPWPAPLSTFVPFGYAAVANESAIASASSGRDFRC